MGNLDPFRTIISIFLLFNAAYCYAQENVSVYGKVTDEDNSPLEGVVVGIKGTSVQHETESDGAFVLITSPQTKLTFEKEGYLPLEVVVGKQRIIDVSMVLAITTLEEVVTVGYGTQPKKDVTGAIATLSEEDFNRGLMNSPDQLMVGKLAGVDLVPHSGEPGSAYNLRIRGTSSIRAGNDPLYVVDGYPVDIGSISPQMGQGFLTYRPSQLNPFSFLNPSDIVSIDVLKDASAAAIYGARGANGVVMITTRKGRSGKGRLTYQGQSTWSFLPRKIPVLSAKIFNQEQEAYGFSLNNYGDSTDWQSEVYRTAFSHRHDLSWSGGSPRTRYYASLGILDQEGIIRKSDLTQLNARANLFHRAIEDRLEIELTLLGSEIWENRIPIDIVNNTLSQNPTWPIKDSSGSYFQPFPGPGSNHPVTRIELQEDFILTSRIQGNLGISFEIIPDLRYKITLGADRSAADRRLSIARQVSFWGGEGGISNLRRGSWLNEHTIVWEKESKGNYLKLLGGFSYQEFLYDFYSLRRFNFDNDLLPHYEDLASGKDDYGFGNTLSSHKETLQSFFTRVNYSFKDRYIFTGTIRRDGSSRFGENNPYGNFPSLAFAWRISEENFLRETGFFNDLKLRASWGLTGNQEIGVGLTRSLYQVNNGAILSASNSPTIGYRLQNTPNPDLRWESTRQWNVGLDFSLWEGRLAGTIDFFNKQTRDLLFEVPAASAPSPTIWVNLDGIVKNTGWEASLIGTIVSSSSFTWDVSVNMTAFRNEVNGLPTDVFINLLGGKQIITNGQPLGSFWGSSWLGFDENGDNVYKVDEQGNQVEEVIGHALPDFTFGLTNNLTFLNFDLSFHLYASQGNDAFNATTSAWNLPKQDFPNGNNTTSTILNSDESFATNYSFSSRFVEDASFIRLNYLTLGYEPKTPQVSWFERLRVYVTGENLFVLTSYSGYNPENNTPNFGIPAPGWDYDMYPRARTIQFGVQITFL